MLVSGFRIAKRFSNKNYWFSVGMTRMSSTLTTNFEQAKKKLSMLQNDPGNDAKLKIYGLFKQSTVGPCTVSKPSAFDFVGKAKWEAWNSLGSMTKEQAMAQYIATVEKLTDTDSVSGTAPSTSSGKYEGITFEVDGSISRITFSRPQKKNALSTQMYKDIPLALKEAAENDTHFAVITGEGDYYSSGNDLANFTSFQGDLSTAAQDGANLLKSFVAAFIDFPKPLIAVVNGPAVGIPVTLLALCDVVYASDRATFVTPFSLLGQTPEACATYTFPKIMGYAKANEVLLFSKKLIAQEAKEACLVTEVFAERDFKQEVEKRLQSFINGSKSSMMYSKKLIRDVERETLHRVNASECERLSERWQSPDCMEAIMKFFQNKGKL